MRSPPFRIRGSLDREEGHKELISSDATQQVVFAHTFPQALRNLAEQEVPDFIPQGVIDSFETVQIDEEKGGLRCITTPAVEPIAQQLGEGTAVQEPGESVVLGLMEEKLGELTLFDGDGGQLGHFLGELDFLLGGLVDRAPKERYRAERAPFS